MARMFSLYNPGPHSIENWMFSPEEGHNAYYSLPEGARLDLPAAAGDRMLKDHPWLQKVDDFDPEEIALEAKKKQLEKEVKELEERKVALGGEEPKEEGQKDSDLSEKKPEEEEEAQGGKRDLPEKERHLCRECGFEAKNKNGLRMHMRKHK